MLTPSQINLIKDATNNFVLLKKLKNTESAHCAQHCTILSVSQMLTHSVSIVSVLLIQARQAGHSAYFWDFKKN